MASRLSNPSAAKPTVGLRRRHQIESLEGRSLMAGDVTVAFNPANNRWTLTGDNFGNQVSIEGSPLGGLQAVGVAGTTLNGVALPVQLGVVDDLFANLGAGGDSISIEDMIGFNHGQNISINTGDGSDNVLIDNITLSGNLSIVTGNGNDTIDATQQIGGNLRISSGNGNDSVTVWGNSGLSIMANGQVDPNYVFNGAIGGGIQANINTGRGADSLFFNNGVDGDLTINMGTEKDVLTIFSTQVADQTDVDTGAGNDFAEVTASAFSGPTAFDMGVGNDELTLDIFTPALSTGPFGFDGGAGFDILDRNGLAYGAVINFEVLI
jgi:hypothetical protein